MIVSSPHHQSSQFIGSGAPSSSQIDARGGDKLEAATAYLARKLVLEPYR